jgi:5-deoxy-glucuronate isomerase
MSKLLVKPSRSSEFGIVHRISPATAGWTYVGFEVLDLDAGQTFKEETHDREVCLVLVSGKATVTAGGMDFGVIGGRMNPFEGSPDSVYVPAKSHWSITAETDVELAICSAPGTGALPARLIPAAEVGQETRGVGTNVRYVRNILPDSSPHAESLLVCEVITPGGHWSSYPPHKHDRDALPAESYLEETYYHRISPKQGYAVQRVYTDDRSIDETMVVNDRDVVLVPKGYHPVGAAHGYDLYYLNTMAGPKRAWKFHNDPDHEWLFVKK